MRRRMGYYLQAIVLLVLVTASFRQVEAKTNRPNKVLMISFDGFRWDYPKLFDTPNLDYMAQTGVHAPSGIRTAFVTKTLTTHFSIATGLYAESHGIVDSNMFDPVLNRTFNTGNNESVWWDVGGEPLWITARLRGLRSGVFYWPGSEAQIHGMYPNFYQKYNDKVNYNGRAERVVQWLANDQVDLAMMYFNEPDNAGHHYGAASNQVGKMVQRVDSVLGYIFKMLRQRNMLDQVNILVVSDHGMANITTEDDHLIVLKDYIHMKNEVQVATGMGPVAMILPRPGKESVVYRKLRNAHPKMRVYWKEEVPERLRYRYHRRILPIVLIADVGYLISINRRDDSLIGNHGYDNMEPSMNPIFYARGPAFKTNFKAHLFESVDIYPLVCHLLGIPPAPNNGSLNRVAHILKDSQKALHKTAYGRSHDALRQRLSLIRPTRDLTEQNDGGEQNLSPLKHPHLQSPKVVPDEREENSTEGKVYDEDEVGETWQWN